MIQPKDLRIPFTWDERRPIFLDRCLYIPAVYDHAEWKASGWEKFFDAEQPVIVEYCSGNGQWIGERAQQNPHRNWVAVERRFERARKIWAKIHREGISNLFVVCGEALIFTQFHLLPGSVAEVYVNFPDPWPKRRHGKHQLIAPRFLEELSRVTVPGGKATCVTDDPRYAAKIDQEFSRCPDWQSQPMTQEWSHYGRSFFGDLWVERGRTIHFLSYEKRR